MWNAANRIWSYAHAASEKLWQHLNAMQSLLTSWQLADAAAQSHGLHPRTFFVLHSSPVEDERQEGEEAEHGGDEGQHIGGHIRVGGGGRPVIACRQGQGGDQFVPTTCYKVGLEPGFWPPKLHNLGGTCQLLPIQGLRPSKIGSTMRDSLLSQLLVWDLCAVSTTPLSSTKKEEKR
jgi:hypothetical protein